MTIKVRTLDHGELSFDADDWDTRESGDLWVGVEETGTGVAEFAKGAWLFVYEENDEPPKREPRVWKTFDDMAGAANSVARHTKAKNCYGVEWTLFTPEDAQFGLDRNEWLWAMRDGKDYPGSEELRVGPFVEVLDD